MKDKNREFADLSRDERETEGVFQDSSVQNDTGTIEWFLEQSGGTPEEKELKRKAWEYMEYGAYDDALKILWKHFPDEYPIPDAEKDRYASGEKERK